MIGKLNLNMKIKKIANIIFNRIKKGYQIPFRAKYPEFEIGKEMDGNPEIFKWDNKTKLKIGAYVSIASGVKIFLGGEHRLDWVTTYAFSVFREKFQNIEGHPMSKGDVVIGNDVWIGADSVILSGVTIGDGAVIGNNSIIRRDVPPYGIVLGNPAKFVRTRFSKEIIDELLKIKWWDWDDKTLDEMIPWMLSNDIEKFILKAKEITETKS